jgi:drug/metabolite transporter (DMT)-like permease
VVAAALGALLGALLTVVSRRASRFVTPDDPMRGFAIYGAFMLARMIAAFVSLGIYYLAVPEGLPPFGLALGVSFIAGLGYEAVKASRLNTSHTSA